MSIYKNNTNYNTEIWDLSEDDFEKEELAYLEKKSKQVVQEELDTSDLDEDGNYIGKEEKEENIKPVKEVKVKEEKVKAVKVKEEKVKPVKEEKVKAVKVKEEKVTIAKDYPKYDGAPSPLPNGWFTGKADVMVHRAAFLKYINTTKQTNCNYENYVKFINENYPVAEVYAKGTFNIICKNNKFMG